jgi:dienelactone hydrolase
MQVIITTDIFGTTPYIKQLAENLSAQALSVSVIDPYHNNEQHFTSEQQAYTAFTQQCGIEGYISLLRQALSDVTQSCVIIGFSAGAASAWKALDGLKDHQIQHMLGFYPGQIRHYLDVTPSCPVTLVFPCSEAHFDLVAVIRQVEKIDAVVCYKTQYQHGFMNPSSLNFCATGATVFNGVISQGHKLFKPALLRSLLGPLM